MREEQQPERNPDGICMELARRQHGVISVAQANQAGLSNAAIHRRVRAGRFTRPYPRTLIVSGTPETWHQQLMAAAVWLGNRWCVSHRSAGRIWNFDAVPEGHLDFAGHSSRHARNGITLHRTSLLPGEVVNRLGFQLTTATRTLLDLGSVLGPDDLEAATESAVRMGLTSIDYLQKTLTRHRARGRNGAGVLAEVLARRPRTAPPTGSIFETRLYQALRKAQLPLPLRQYWICDGEKRLGRVDVAYPDVRLVIEADSYAGHGSRLDWESDIDRYNAVSALGWGILRITWSKLRSRPHEVVEKIAQARGVKRLPLE